jgi:2-oxoglutarate dehydrogenase E2 component (dihydrolipoamide succinyltransferase)
VTSPIVRQLIAEQGLDPSQIAGSGDGGRITRTTCSMRPVRADPPHIRPLRRHRRRPPCRRAPPRLCRAAGDSGGGDEIVPFDNIRRRTAEHMVRSLATSAHVYTSVRVDFERIERVRRAHQQEWKAEEGFALTYLPFIARAFSDVVHDYPHVNASVEGETLIVHRDVNLGIAVDLDFKDSSRR